MLFLSRWQMTGGLLCELVGYIWMIALLGQATKGYNGILHVDLLVVQL